MSKVDKDILRDFLEESRKIVVHCGEILDQIEGHPEQAPRLEEFSNMIDRVMGAAKSLALLVPPDHTFHLIGDCAALCKAVGQRGVQTSKNPVLFDVTISFLQDANEIVTDLVMKIESPSHDIAELARTTLINRLKWINDVYRKLPEELSEKSKLNQNEIDEIMKKLGG